jgi:cytidylate kinase
MENKKGSDAEERVTEKSRERTHLQRFLSIYDIDDLKGEKLLMKVKK